jgi:DNA-binding transcriptional MerR regulator/effector-binding domain-containing protein
MFSIGDFATFTQVSVKTFRHWERVGVLSPARIDPSNGYRYYEAAQVTTVHRIAALQMLGLTLASIRELLDAPPDIDALVGLLRDRQVAAEAEQRRIEHRLAAIRARLHLLEGDHPMAESYDIVDRTAAAVRLAAIAERLAPDLDDPGVLHEVFGRLFGELMGRLGAAGIQPVGPAYSLYERSDEDGLTVHAAIPIAEDATLDDETVLIIERPATRVAATIHTGPLDDLASAYAAMMSWIDARGVAAVGGAAEISLVWAEDEPDRNVTELQIAIVDRDA